MKRASQALWGIALVAAGGLLALKIFGILRFELFFDGWWTMFIIIPCFLGLLYGQDWGGNLIGLCIGLFLLLCSQGVLHFGALWKLVLPAVIVICGAKLIFGGRSKGAEPIPESCDPPRQVTAVFSGQDVNCAGEIFRGASCTAIFGGVDVDLRQAILDQDCVIDACAIFGGVDIRVPAGLNVKVTSNSIFGGVDNKARAAGNPGPTLYINATCLFGGMDIK